nr:reverse transcriptase domain-containing protein [Tanacetum cinerariifolium]
MADNRTMAELLRAPTEGYAEAIVVPPILAEQFELKHSHINMMTTDQFFGLEKDNPHDHIRWFNKITSTIKYRDVPNSVIKLILFPFSLAGAARRWLKKEPPRSITTWEDLLSKFINEFFPSSRTTSIRNEILNFQQKFDESFHEAWDRYKDLLRACPHHGFTEFHQLNTFYNTLNHADQGSLNAVAGGNLLERSTYDVLTIIENKSKVRNSRSKPLVSQVKACDDNSNSEIGKLTYPVNQQTSAVITAMMAMLKQFQATSPPAPVKAVEETCVTCGGAHPYYQCLAAGDNTFSEFRDNIQGYVLAAAVNYNHGSRSLPSNTVANPKGELKAITTRSGLVTDGPTVPTPPKSITPEVDERAKETYTDPDLAKYTIKVPPPLVKKYKPPSQREFIVHKRDPLHPNIPYPSRMLKQKQQEKDEVQIQKFWQMFKQLHINISFADALVLMPKYQKMLKSLLSNKEKLQELANTPFNENCSVVILKKLPKKLKDPGKFLISCGFSELKCKALADLGASINLMPLSVWKELGLPELIPTRKTLELANRAICTPTGIARYVFVPVVKFTFPTDFVIVDYESDSRVPFILGRPFLWTARALIDVHGEEMILRDDLNYTKDLHPPLDDNLLSGSTTYSYNSFLEEFTDELALITFPPEYDDNFQFDIESDLKEIEFLLYQDKDSSLKDSIDQKGLANLIAIFVDPIPEMFTDEHTLDYSSPPKFDGEKIKESKLLIDELDLPGNFLPPFKYDSFISQDFSRVDALLSTNNEDKVFNPGIIIQEKPVKITTRVVQDKKLAISNAFLVLEDSDPPFYEPLFFKEVPKAKMLLSFSSENEEKVFKPGIHTSEKVHSYFIPELSYPGYHVFKINQIFKSLMNIFLHYGKNTPILDVPLFYFYPP